MNGEAQDGIATRGLAVHCLERIGDQVDENLLAELGVRKDFRQTRGVVSFYFDPRIRELVLHRFEGVVNDLGYMKRAQFHVLWAGKIEKAGDERVQAIHFGRDEAGKLGCERLRWLQFLAEHFGGAFDDAERIANFVREAGGELSEGGESLRAARFGFGALQLAIRLLERREQLLRFARPGAGFPRRSD